MWKPNTYYRVDGEQVGWKEEECYIFKTDSKAITCSITRVGKYKPNLGEVQPCYHYAFPCFKELKPKTKSHLPKWW